MEEARKSFYTIPEAAKLKGVSEEELCAMIRQRDIQTKQIGLRQMIPAAELFEGVKSKNQVEQYLERLKPRLIEMLEDAPEYGSCGITITFHAKEIVKVSKQCDHTYLKDKGK